MFSKLPKIPLEHVEIIWSEVLLLKAGQSGHVNAHDVALSFKEAVGRFPRVATVAELVDLLPE